VLGRCWAGALVGLVCGATILYALIVLTLSGLKLALAR